LIRTGIVPCGIPLALAERATVFTEDLRTIDGQQLAHHNASCGANPRAIYGMKRSSANLSPSRRHVTAAHRQLEVAAPSQHRPGDAGKLIGEPIYRPNSPETCAMLGAVKANTNRAARRH
jgi:hypothetical protein